MKPMPVARSMVVNVERILRQGMRIRPSFTPSADSRPWLSMNTNTSATAKSPTIATRKSMPSIMCMLPKVKRGMPVALSSPIMAMPSPMQVAIRALA